MANNERSVDNPYGQVPLPADTTTPKLAPKHSQPLPADTTPTKKATAPKPTPRPPAPPAPDPQRGLSPHARLGITRREYKFGAPREGERLVGEPGVLGNKITQSIIDANGNGRVWIKGPATSEQQAAWEVHKRSGYRNTSPKAPPSPLTKGK